MSRKSNESNVTSQAEKSRGWTVVTRGAIDAPRLSALSQGAQLLYQRLLHGEFSLAVPGVAVATRQQIATAMQRGERMVQYYLRELQCAALIECDNASAAIRVLPALGVNPRVQSITPLAVWTWAAQLAHMKQTPFVARLIERVKALVYQQSAQLAQAFMTRLAKVQSAIARRLFSARGAGKEQRSTYQRSTQVLTSRAKKPPLAAPVGQLDFAWSLKSLVMRVGDALKTGLQEVQGAGRVRQSNDGRAMGAEMGKPTKEQTRQREDERARRQREQTHDLVEAAQKAARDPVQQARNRERSRALGRLFGKRLARVRDAEDS